MQLLQQSLAISAANSDTKSGSSAVKLFTDDGSDSDVVNWNDPALVG